MINTRALVYFAERIKDRKFYSVHRRFRDYTMIPQRTYVANLRLANSVASIPGAIVECGTWKGGMIAGMAQVLGSNRDFFLFDSFEGLPPAEEVDGRSAKKWQEDTTSPGYYNNCTASLNDAENAMSLAGISNARVIKGWFENTLSLERFPQGIAVLRMDADWYKSTMQVLETLFSFVNNDGLIIIDDYYNWDGCAKAVHDYLSKYQRPERIHSYRGVCYIRKVISD